MDEFTISVLTWNIYLGADVARVIGAEPDVVPARVAALWKMVGQTNFPARARAIAEQIRLLQPDVIALQEVFRWSSVRRRPLEEGASVETVEYDFLRILLDELARIGLRYFAAVRSPGVDVLLPSEGGPDIRLEDSVVILVRTGEGMSGFTWHKPRRSRFAVNLSVPLDGEPFSIERCWASVDLRRGGTTFRIIDLHLEAFDPAGVIQPAQIKDILSGPAAISGPLIVTGDFNSPAGMDTWQTFASLGYVDAWVAGGVGDGATCCQKEDLRNPESLLSERIDWILCRGTTDIRDVKRIGAEPADRTAEMWPSDHAGVFTRLVVPQSSLGSSV